MFLNLSKNKKTNWCAKFIPRIQACLKVHTTSIEFEWNKNVKLKPAQVYFGNFHNEKLTPWSTKYACI